MSSLNRFNRLAGSYDLLVTMVFGNVLQKAQAVFLEDIQHNANILILGGGTGRILFDLMAAQPFCQVWFIEASSSMLKSASGKAHVSWRERIHFIHGTEDAIPEGITFDVVITNFFLDLFPEAELQVVIEKIKRSLKPGGRWMVSDFLDTNRIWQRILLKIMYLFFNATCSVRAKWLPPWERQIEANSFVKNKEASFLQGFVRSAVFLKKSVNDQ